jgi:outer membrane protein OmpA-like peptidoglycan-associated protein
MFLTSLSFISQLKGQDARLSQIWSFPSMMNPSLVGASDDQFLAGLGYSNQKTKKSQVNHQYAFLNGRFAKDYAKTGKAFGLGASFYQYGSVNPINPSPLNAKFFAISGAYHIRLSKDESHILSIGSQFAFANATASEKGSFYEKEINGGGFRWTNMDSSGLRKDIAGYLDWNLGVNYKYTGENITIEAGIGGYHFTHPQMSIITPDKETKLRGRMVFHGKIDIQVAPKRALVYNNIFWSEGLYWRSNWIDLYTLVANWSGVEFVKTDMSDNKFAMNYGLYTRSFKTVMPYLSAFPGRGTNLRISYEIPIATQQLYQSYTAKRFELSILYTPVKRDKDGKPKNDSRKYVNQKERARRDSLLQKSDSIQQKQLENKRVADSIANLRNEGFKSGAMAAGDRFGDRSGDRDGDGLSDYIDGCPDQPGPVENQGCPNVLKTSSNKPIYNPEEYYSSMSTADFSLKDTVQFYTFFDLNSARLTQNSYVLLNKIVGFLKRNSDYRCVIEGHADFEGNDEANWKISEKRASVVKNYLTSYGISGMRLQSSYFGKTRMLPIFDKNLMWMNRRDEILLIKYK